MATFSDCIQDSPWTLSCLSRCLTMASSALTRSLEALHSSGHSIRTIHFRNPSATCLLPSASLWLRSPSLAICPIMTTFFPFPPVIHNTDQILQKNWIWCVSHLHKVLCGCCLDQIQFFILPCEICLYGAIYIKLPKYNLILSDTLSWTLLHRNKFSAAFHVLSFLQFFASCEFHFFFLSAWSLLTNNCVLTMFQEIWLECFLP